MSSTPDREYAFILIDNLDSFGNVLGRAGLDYTCWNNFLLLLAKVPLPEAHWLFVIECCYSQCVHKCCTLIMVIYQ
jgi:hypothetical protein